MAATTSLRSALSCGVLLLSMLFVWLGIAACLVLSYLPGIFSSHPLFRLSSHTAAPVQHSTWPGWSNIDTIFSFGDSYTTTYFDPYKGPQPSISNPTGNPPYGTKTSCNGPNWLEFLTYNYNDSIIQTYNLASGGATINETIIKPAFPLTRSMRSQIEDVFVPLYGRDERLKGQNTLFTFWIGINDIALMQMLPDLKALPADLLHSYRSLVRTVYDLGARNFVFINVPPIDRAPWANGFSAEGAKNVSRNIATYNDHLASMVSTFRASYTNATMFHFDAHALVNAILDDPTNHIETSGYRNTTGYCGAYANGTPERDTTYAQCGASVDEYFWLNTLHPTFPLHRATAASIARLLDRGV